MNAHKQKISNECSTSPPIGQKKAEKLRNCNKHGPGGARQESDDEMDRKEEPGRATSLYELGGKTISLPILGFLLFWMNVGCLDGCLP